MSLSLNDIIQAKARMDAIAPPKIESLIRTDFGIFKINWDQMPNPFGIRHPFPIGLGCIPIRDFGDSEAVHRARVRLSKLKSKKRRGRRNGAAVRLLKNVPPTIRELERAMEARNRE